LDTPQDNRFHLVRDICWQIEKACSTGYMEIEDSYSPDEIHTKTRFLCLLSDYGFTHVSNDHAPFFSVFPEYGSNFSEFFTIAGGAAASPLDTSNAIFKISFRYNLEIKM